MKRFKSIVLVVLVAAVAVGFSVLPAPTVEAQGSAALSVTPRKDYRAIEPGKGVSDTLVIRNLDRERTLELSLRVVDFTYSDDGGMAKFMLDPDAPQTTWSLKPFLTAPESVSVAPGESQTIDIRVDIPANQGAGSFYSAILYSSGASDGGNVGLSASTATLIFAGVPGDVTEKLTLENLGAYSSQTGKYTKFTTETPARIAYTLKNEGNVVEAPAGTITLKALFGRETLINNINTNESLALIGQTRTFETCIALRSEPVNFNGSREEASTCADAGLWPGFYRVQMDAFYGQNGNLTREIGGSSWCIYAPWWFVVVLLLALLFVSYHIWRIVRYIRGKRGGRTSTRTARSRKR